MFDTDQASATLAMADLPATFRPAELRWATDGWAAVAPGFGGWHVECEDWGRGNQLAVYPPTVFHTHRTGLGFVVTAESDRIVVEGQGDWGDLWHLATFPTLRDALLHLCPLTTEQLIMADTLAADATSPKSQQKSSSFLKKRTKKLLSV